MSCFPAIKGNCIPYGEGTISSIVAIFISGATWIRMILPLICHISTWNSKSLYYIYLTNKHKSGVYDDAQYLNAVIKANGDYDLPANAQGFIRRIDNDSN